jgi:hypothetical protein
MYSKRKQNDRDFHIYQLANNPNIWRIRLHLYPEHSGYGESRNWYGGRILWGYDQESYKEAHKIAMRWKKYGEIPPEK